MVLFIVRRLWLAALVCLTVLCVSFILTRLSGDLAASIEGQNASAADIAIITRNYGLDRPLVAQFLDWAGHAAKGDLGRSFLYHAPVWGLIRDRLPVTLTLGLTGLAVALVVDLPLGILSAVEGARCGDAGGLDRGRAAWLYAGRVGGDRVGIRTAGRRLSGLGIDHQKRFSRRPGGGAVPGRHLHRADLAGRHDECAARSEAAGMSGEVIVQTVPGPRRLGPFPHFFTLLVSVFVGAARLVAMFRA